MIQHPLPPLVALEIVSLFSHLLGSQVLPVPLWRQYGTKTSLTIPMTLVHFTCFVLLAQHDTHFGSLLQCPRYTHTQCYKLLSFVDFCIGTFIQMEMSSILRVVKVSLRYILRATAWEAMTGRKEKLLLLAPTYRPKSQWAPWRAHWNRCDETGIILNVKVQAMITVGLLTHILKQVWRGQVSLAMWRYRP